MKITRFEDILAWQMAKQLSLDIHESIRHCKDFAFRDQIQRASVSIMNNIAEGYERNGNKEFRNFLFIAKGSSAEVRSMLELAKELGYMDEEKAKAMSEKATSISKMLSGLIKSLS